jgi:alpha-ribazole phosphatase
MSPTGYQQAERLRDRLANEKIDAVYSSDLRRAVLTAEIVSSGRGVDIKTCAELREINYGQVEGLTFEEIRDLYPELAESVSSFSPGLNFPGGESFGEFVERTRKFLERLEQNPAPTTLIVSHNGPLRLLVCALLGIDTGHWRQIRIDNASLTIMETSPRGVVINLLNDSSHLASS